MQRLKLFFQGSAVFLLSSGITGVVYAWVEVFVFRHVDPKFRHALPIAFDISLIALGVFLLAGFVAFLGGMALSKRWPSSQALPLAQLPLGGLFWIASLLVGATLLSKLTSNDLLLLVIWAWVALPPFFLGRAFTSQD